MAALTTLGVAFPLALPAQAVVSTAGSAPVAMFAVVPDGSSMKVVRFEATDAFAAQSLEAEGAADGEVVSIDSPVHSLGTADPLRPQQWALDAVDFGGVWPTTRGAGVTVAIVDSGVLGNHEDLAGSVLQGTDLVGSGNGWNDELGHGTHLAGVIAGARRERPRHHRRGAEREDPSRARARRRWLGFVVRRRGGDHLRGRPRRAGDQPQPGRHQRRRRYAHRDPVRRLEGLGRARGRRERRTVGKPAHLPGRVPRSGRGRRGRLASAARRRSRTSATTSMSLLPASTCCRPTTRSTHSYAWGSGTSMATPYAAAEAALIVAADPTRDVASVAAPDGGHRSRSRTGRS